MANYVSSAGVIDRSIFPSLLDRDIDVMWMQRNTLAGVVLAQFFDTETKDSGLTHVITSVTSQLPLPQESEDTDALPYFQPEPGYPKTITLLNYRSGIRITDTALRAERYSKLVAMTKGQITSAAQLDEYMRASIFNNAFTGDAGADSKDLCDDDHPHENVAAGTWDNKGTGAMSGPNLQALRLLARKMTGPQGDPAWVTPKTLLVPEDLEQKARELTQSAQTAENALNTATVLIPGLNIVVSPYLSSAVQYFLIGDLAGYEKGLCEVVLEDWNIKDRAADPDVPINKRIKAIKAFAFTRSKNVYGSTGA